VDEHDDIKAVTDACLRLFAMENASRAAMLEDAADGIEWTANVLLRNLANLGPVRASNVADSLHLDPSTVSRQVAGLVRDGLLERQSDPRDGRAAILVPTAAGRAQIAAYEGRRVAYFKRMLTDWDDGEIAQLGRLMARFADDYGDAHESWMATRSERRSDRLARASVHAR
jgi:DNA-binding MarR family transcriptional regulator